MLYYNIVIPLVCRPKSLTLTFTIFYKHVINMITDTMVIIVTVMHMLLLHYMLIAFKEVVPVQCPQVHVHTLIIDLLLLLLFLSLK